MQIEPARSWAAAGGARAGASAPLLPVGAGVLPRGQARWAPGHRGLVIALSGVDCAGKSTQREHLIDALRSWGHAPITIWSRAGHTPALKSLERAWRALRGRRASDFEQPLCRWIWQTTALLELLWLYAVRLRLWRAAGRVVICDRYLLDCLVDLRVNFPAQRVEERWLTRVLRCCAVRPDVSFCLLIPAEETDLRARAKGRFHGETLEVLRLRREAYRALTTELSVAVLDGRRPASELALTARRRVLSALLGAAPVPART